MNLITYVILSFFLLAPFIVTLFSICPRTYTSILKIAWLLCTATLQDLYVRPNNEVYVRHLLVTRRQQAGKSFDEYLQALKKNSDSLNTLHLERGCLLCPLKKHFCPHATGVAARVGWSTGNSGTTSTEGTAAFTGGLGT